MPWVAYWNDPYSASHASFQNDPSQLAEPVIRFAVDARYGLAVLALKSIDSATTKNLPEQSVEIN